MMIKKLFILLTILILPALLLIGCVNDMEQFQGVSPTSDFTVQLVPNTNLDVYIYAKQSNLTTIPADLINMSHDIDVESLAIWGVPGEKSMIFGVGLTFSDGKTAGDVYQLIPENNDIWKFIRGNNLYIVKGSGTAAESLKTSIKNDDFKVYKNTKLKDAADLLPKSVRAKLISIAFAKPSKQVMNFIAENMGSQNLEQINQILKLSNLEVMIAGLYSPHQINIARAVEIVRGKGNMADLDVGLLVAVKSSLPGILVEPAVREIIQQQGLVATRVNDITLYKGSWKSSNFPTIPVYARVAGNYVFVALSGQADYAQTIITSIYK